MDPVVLRAMDPGPPRAHSNPNKESMGDVDSNSACSLVCNGSFPIYGNIGKQTDRLCYIATARLQLHLTMGGGAHLVHSTDLYPYLYYPYISLPSLKSLQMC